MSRQYDLGFIKLNSEGGEPWPRKKRSPVSFAIKQNTRLFYFHVGRADRIFGYAPDVYPGSFTAAKTAILLISPIVKGG
jgi:hypothetical protein